ncbi:CpaF family protein [Yoonia sp.]|uniref:CpaF family protein n=1 Tax=Yoonia sp. TaxID=2212373 RepID=UPI001A0E7B29|nr:CpaF family protein [Yoonia sp.]MBE0413740.1 CpaF family protein [Yoonia sp.]
MFNDFILRKADATPASHGDTAVADRVEKPAPIDNKVVPLQTLPKADSNLRARLDLKSRLHEELLGRLNLAALDRIERSDLHREISALVIEFLANEHLPMRSDDTEQLTTELLDEVLGLGPLEPILADPDVADVLVNSFDNVYVERHGKLERVPVQFRDERHLMRIIDKIVSRVGRRVDESQPWVDARLEDGSRVNAIIRPCAIDGPTLSIRKFSRDALTLERLLEMGTLTPGSVQLLRGLVEARLNILISGGTGSGKTTMLNALSAFIDPTQRIVTIEDAAELQLKQDHVVRLETRPSTAEGTTAVTQRDLLRNALRMRPDRIIVGEVRGTEAFDMLQAMNTGHDGSMTTIHANNARDALARLEQMVSMMGGEMPLSSVRRQIASGLEVVLQLARMADGRRRIMSITEVTGMEGDVITMQDIFVFRQRGRSETGEVLGEFIATGIRPRCAERLAAAGVDIASDAYQNGGQ